MYTPYFEDGFNEQVRTFILSKWSPEAGLSCVLESHQWAKKLLENFVDLDLEVHEGFAVIDGDPDDSEGHTWLVVDGVVFDPTYAQFECDFIEYDTHIYWDSDTLIEYLEDYGYTINLPESVDDAGPNI